MVYPEDFESKTGFSSVRVRLAELCRSRLGKECVASISFSDDYTEIRRRLGCVDEMKRLMEEAAPYPVPSANDVLPYLTRLKAVGSYITAEQLWQLLQVLESFDEINRFFREQQGEESSAGKLKYLAEEFAELSTFPHLSSEIGRAVNKFGELNDNASPGLFAIRQQIRRAQGSVQRAISRVLERASGAGIVEKDVTPAVRDGRLVIPVAASRKRELGGIVHDESATGKTVYIEPAEVVEASNRLREMELEEQREVIAVLTGLADLIRPESDNIARGCRLLGELDFIEAKARYAIETGAQMPNLSKEPELEWYHAVHPGLMLSLRQQGREVVPLYLTLGKDQRILIISGPNAGGKSVTLKTVAIVQYMMQCGLLPTLYYNSHMGVFRKIFIDIGDEQSIENDLSTYSSHLRNMRYFLRNADRRTLLMADEMGSGTEPQIGGAIAQAILGELVKSGCIGIITTHYHNLKTFADTTEGCVNGAMLYDRQHLQPTFQLSVGTPGSSFALDIAYKMGLPKEVIDNAKEIVGSDYINLDKYLSDISRDRKYWANKRQNIREKEARLDALLGKYDAVAADVRAERREIIGEARREAAEILKNANAQIERTILEIRTAQAEKERTKQVRRELEAFKEKNASEQQEDETSLDRKLKPLRRGKKEKKEVKPAPEKKEERKELGAGDYVKMKDGNGVGQIMSLSGKKAEVAFGNLRTIVELDRLERAKKPKESALKGVAGISGSTTAESRDRQLNFRNEIDVRGMRADEALQAVTYFIDDAVQFGAGKVRILHGTGHGILKTLIRQQLKSTPGVAHFEDEDIRFGGAGITVVELD